MNPLFVSVFEEPEDPSARSFFSEIISSVSDVKFSHSGRYLLTRDYLTAKVWDLNMESKPLETYQVSERPHVESKGELWRRRNDKTEYFHLESAAVMRFLLARS